MINYISVSACKKGRDSSPDDVTSVSLLDDGRFDHENGNSVVMLSNDNKFN